MRRQNTSFRPLGLNLILLAFYTFLLPFESMTQSDISWDPTMSVATGTYGNLHPRVVTDASGNPLVIWGRSFDEALFFSRWNGSAFSTPVKLSGALTIATASWMGPDIAAHGDTVYVAMKETPESSSASHIYLVHSYDGGASFSQPVRVDYIADSISRFPVVATDANGTPLVAFMKFNASFGDSRWVVASSSDFGSTFLPDVKASGWGGAEVCDCCPGALVSAGDSRAMLYRNNKSNLRDTWMSVSSDNGASFSNGINIDNNNWMLSSCPASGPDGIAIGDTVFSVFMNGASGTYRCYLSKSSVSTVAVNTVTGLTGNIPGLVEQNYPRIASHGNAVAVVWTQRVGGSRQLPILFTNDIIKGFPATYDTVDLDFITNADVAVSNSRVFVVWEDNNSGTVRFRSGTFMPPTSGTQPGQHNADRLTAFPNPSNDFWNIEGYIAGKVAAVELYDIAGTLISQPDAPPQHDPFSISIDNRNLPQGIYILKVKTASGIQTIRLVKS